MATEKKLSQETNQITDLTNDVRFYGIEDATGTPVSGWIDPDDIVDATAIHKSTAAEISAIAEKTTLVDDDLVLIEDSENGFIKKKAKKSKFGTANAKTISKGNTFLPAIVFNYDEKYFNQYTQSGALAITLDSNTNGVASYIYTSIVTDGNNITFPAGWKEITNEYINDVAIYGLIVFYDGNYYQYSLYLIKTISASAVDISYFELANDNSYIDVTFDGGIYGEDDGSSPAVLSDFQITNFVAGGITSNSISSITKTTGAALSGGETTIRCSLSNTGTADGTAKLEIQPASALSLYDSGGDPLLSSITTTIVYLIKDVTPAALTFQPGNLSNLVEAGTIYTAQSASSWINKGLADENITSEGYIQSDIISTSGDISMIGFNEANSNDAWTSLEEGLYTNGTTLVKVINGAFTVLNIAPANGSKMRLRRSGNKTIGEYTTDGNKYRKLYDSSRTSTATYYLQIFARSTGETVSNPKIGV